MNNLAICTDSIDTPLDKTSFSSTDNKPVNEKLLSKSLSPTISFKKYNKDICNNLTQISSKFNLQYELGSITLDAIDDIHESNEETSFELNKQQVVEDLESEFFCTIDSVDEVNKELCASVYDIEENMQVMTITVPFSNFLNSEVSKIIPNAGFYWRIGTRTTNKNLNNKLVPHSENFSDFRMRLTYVSPRALKGRLENNFQKYSNIFV